MGWLNIYSAVFAEDHASIFDTTQRYGMQLIWIAAAILIAILVLAIDARFYIVFANYFFILLLLILVFVIFFGVEVNASKSWIQFGSFRIQPAEFAKFTTALALAKYMSSYGFKLNSVKSYILSSLIVLAPVTLILLQNDAGTAIVFAAFIWVFYREGMPNWVVAFFVFLAVLFIMVLIFNKFIVLLLLILLGIVLFGVISKDYQNAIRFSFGLFGLVAIIYGTSEFFDLNISLYYLVLIPVAISIPIVIIYSYINKAKFAVLLLLILIHNNFFL
jgi:rod shape determining protein RodA